MTFGAKMSTWHLSFSIFSKGEGMIDDQANRIVEEACANITEASSKLEKDAWSKNREYVIKELDRMEAQIAVMRAAVIVEEVYYGS